MEVHIRRERSRLRPDVADDVEGKGGVLGLKGAEEEWHPGRPTAPAQDQQAHARRRDAGHRARCRRRPAGQKRPEQPSARAHDLGPAVATSVAGTLVSSPRDARRTKVRGARRSRVYAISNTCNSVITRRFYGGRMNTGVGPSSVPNSRLHQSTERRTLHTHDGGAGPSQGTRAARIARPRAGK